jgi:hypothetical protein
MILSYTAITCTVIIRLPYNVNVKWKLIFLAWAYFYQCETTKEKLRAVSFALEDTF